MARGWEFEPGTILIFDKGYVDYCWYERLTQQGFPSSPGCGPTPPI